MDEDPAGTPNPLNPTASNEPVISKPVAERNEEQPQVSETKATEEEPKEVKKVEKKPAQKKSKKPLIITIIVLLLLAIGAGVAAILILKPFSTPHDAVPAAVSKLFTSGVPENIKMSGTVTTFDNNSEAIAPSISMDFSTEINTKTGENIADATVKATLLGDIATFNFKVSEMRTKNGDLYLKLDGVEQLKAFSPVFETIDDEWIKLPGSDFSSIDSILPDTTAATCLVDAAGKLGQYGQNFVTLYNENPFVEYSTADLNIEKKKDPLYRLYFDSAKLTGFVNSLNGSGFANELLACMDAGATNVDMTETEMAEVVKALPTIYVEIDDKDNFTRVYISVKSDDGLSGAVADVSFEYPSTAVNIEEPQYYISLGTFLTQLLSDFYGEDITD